MKIVIQNGNNIGKLELESFISEIPESWKKLFSTIVVHGSIDTMLRISYYGPNSTIGIHCPETYKGTSVEVINELIVCLSALNDFGHIPNKISTSRRISYLDNWHQKISSNR